MSPSTPPLDPNATLPSSVPWHPTLQGSGRGIMRILQFSGLLSSDTIQTQKLRLSYWESLIREYFTPQAIMRLKLRRNSLDHEIKAFEIGVPILPRFFLVTTQSGADSMSLTLDGARERLLHPGQTIVECGSTIWIFRYSNGHVVMLRGSMTARLIACSTPSQHGVRLPP
ncbi:LIM-domain binding protein-domain-containing protein [Mycena olivaceomarginata]|nr:LIM-domain binding protein-domain-containing protein [Mycena olivaceomarginata]